MLLTGWWTHYLGSVSAGDSVLIPLSLMFFELSGYYVNVVRRVSSRTASSAYTQYGPRQ
jgi:hypothetical protein